MPEMIYYDGTCGFCHGWVRFVAEHDPAGRFHFAPKASAAYQRIPAETRAKIPASVVVQREDGALLVKSDASLYVLARLQTPLASVGKVVQWVPRPLRDLGYSFVAAIRHHLAGKRDTACPMLPPELRARVHLDA